MQTMRGWALADSWPFAPPAGLLKPLTLMAVVPAIGAFYLDGVPIVGRVLFALGVVMATYLLISAMLYVAMRGAQLPAARLEISRSDAGPLVGPADAFGDGIGIEPLQWRYFRDGDELFAAAAISGGAVVALSPNQGGLGGDGFGVDFVGRAGSGRLILVSQHAPILPIKDLNWYFDTRAGARERSDLLAELLGDESRFDVDAFGQMSADMNLAKQAGFVRFALTWGRSLWRRRGVVYGLT